MFFGSNRPFLLEQILGVVSTNHSRICCTTTKLEQIVGGAHIPRELPCEDTVGIMLIFIYKIESIISLY